MALSQIYWPRDQPVLLKSLHFQFSIKGVRVPHFRLLACWSIAAKSYPLPTVPRLTHVPPNDLIAFLPRKCFTAELTTF
ncbi:hypothetical protein ASF28_08815 [Methylobacterium sp. Leaf99]|nr:hypothetical protein ASF28_08815 [Methylobacterium sp. Leaf99]